MFSLIQTEEKSELLVLKDGSVLLKDEVDEDLMVYSVLVPVE